MQYLIIREIQYQNLDNSFDVINQTTDINKANEHTVDFFVCLAVTKPSPAPRRQRRPTFEEF